MKAKEYPALIDAIETGVLCGLSRADKHVDDALTDAQRNRVHRHVSAALLDAISERFRFEGGPEE